MSEGIEVAERVGWTGYFEQIAEALSKEYGVRRGKPASKTFGKWSLLVDDKTFARTSPGGHFAVRLPQERINQLVTDGAGHRLEPTRGRPLKEWLAIRSDSLAEWHALAREALVFVRSLDRG